MTLLGGLLIAVGGLVCGQEKSPAPLSPAAPPNAGAEGAAPAPQAGGSNPATKAASAESPPSPSAGPPGDLPPGKAPAGSAPTPGSADGQGNPATGENAASTAGATSDPTQLTPAKPSTPPAPPPPEMRPYRVRVDLRIDLGAGHSASAEARMRAEILTILRGQVGSFLQLTEGDPRERLVASAGDLDRLTVERLATIEAGDYDKILLASLDRDLGDTVCRAREWDASTRSIGPLVTRTTPAAAEAAITLVGVLRAVFRPVAMVEQTKEGVITLRGRGTHTPPHDPAWAPLAAGTVFEPYYRYLTKERKVDKIQRIPWTYLVCGETDPDLGTAGAAPVSGLRTAISARRRRIEAVALGVPIGVEATTVRLRTRPPARRPIVGVEVLVQAERYVPPPAEGQSPPPPLARLVSDRRGEFRLPTSVTAAGKAVWLFVYSGSQLLGRVPMVPGLRDFEELELSDDSLRLQVEGDIALLQARLVDLAAQRAVQMATARKRAADKDFAGAEELIKRVEEGIKPPVLLAELNTVRSPALKLARDQRDKQTEARIKKLCDDTAEIITVHFGPEGILDLRDEVTELKEIAEDEAAGIQPRPKTQRAPRAKRPSKGAKPAANEPAATDQPPPPPTANTAA